MENGGGAPNKTGRKLRAAMPGQRPGPRYGLRNKLPDATQSGQWYRMSNVDNATTKGGRATIDIFGEIGMYGVDAAQFVGELRSLDVAEMEVHIGSPGGDVFEGLAIYQALLDHPAFVDVQVDSVAASIASVIAQAGDRITVGANASMMIHDAMGFSMGNAADMREMAEHLDRASDNIANIYATRSGQGTTNAWRKLMIAETWFDAAEAVEHGLADRASKPGKRSDTKDVDLRKLTNESAWKQMLDTLRERAGLPPHGPGAGGGPGRPVHSLTVTPGRPARPEADIVDSADTSDNEPATDVTTTVGDVEIPEPVADLAAETDIDWAEISAALDAHLNGTNPRRRMVDAAVDAFADTDPHVVRELLQVFADGMNPDPEAIANGIRQMGEAFEPDLINLDAVLEDTAHEHDHRRINDDPPGKINTNTSGPDLGRTTDVLLEELNT